MRTIHKYSISMRRETVLSIPENAEILSAGLDGHNSPSIWILLNPEAPTVKKTFVVRGTGHTVENNLWFVKTFKQQPYIWHLFEKL